MFELVDMAVMVLAWSGGARHRLRLWLILVYVYRRTCWSFHQNQFPLRGRSRLWPSRKS